MDIEPMFDDGDDPKWFWVDGDPVEEGTEEAQ